MITVIGIEDEIPDKLGDSQTLPSDERIAIHTHRYEFWLRESSTLTIHER